MTHYWKKTDTQIIYWKTWIYNDLDVIEQLGIVGEGEKYRESNFATNDKAEEYIIAQTESFKEDGFKECLFEELEVLFVQLYSVGLNIPKEEGFDYMKLLDLRHKTEQVIDNALSAKGLGESFASDLGQGGANILFSVYELEKSFEVIKAVLIENDLLDKTLIAKRVDITKDDWNHKVIYPVGYNGEFYSV